jgi:hypothetical protein
MIFIDMLVPNIINPEKRGKIEGSTFHVFFLDALTASMFDKYMDSPIIYGNKAIVKETVKRLSEHLPKTTTRVRIFFYKILLKDYYIHVGKLYIIL